MGTLKNLTISMVGDLKYGRTVHALVELLSLFGGRLYFVSPSLLNAGRDHLPLKGEGIEVVETEDLKKAAPETDLIYMTRINKEICSDLAEYERVKGTYIINPAVP